MDGGRGGPAATVELDLRGLKCPLPALRTRKALAGTAPGTVIAVTCTDPLAVIDIPHLVHETGHVLEATRGDGRERTFVIRVRHPGAGNPQAGD